MATINRIKGKKKDRFKVLFFLSRKRRALSLGTKYTLRQVQRIAGFVDELVRAFETGDRLSRAAEGFIAEMAPDLRKRFEACGLLPEAEEVTSQDLFDRFYRSIRSLKDSTQRTYVTVEKRFFAFFDPGGDPRGITREDGEAWKEFLFRAGYAQASVCGCFQRMTSVFNWGVEQGLLDENPFKGIRRGSFTNPDRQFFIPRDWYEKLLDACPDQCWRTLISLCRIGGLRNPSETLLLTWHDVDFANQSILVHSPKTERHSGRETRLIPMFPELRKELEASWSLTEEGCSPYVIDKWRDTATNMRTHFQRIIFRAGLPEWPRLFQNLRESRANELWSDYPEHVAAAWMGHSKRIAESHYLQVTDDQFRRALGENAPEKTVPAPPPVPVPRKITRKKCNRLKTVTKAVTVTNENK